MKTKKNKTVNDIIEVDITTSPSAVGKGKFPKFNEIENQRLAKRNLKSKNKKTIEKILKENYVPSAASKGIFPKYNEIND